MPAFKVWSNDRAVKKSCNADTLRELKVKGCDKLDIDLKRFLMIVLAKDGTEIDEDEVLMEFKHEALIFLQTGEQWESMEEIVDSDFVASDFNMMGMDFSSPDVRIIVSGMFGSEISSTANVILLKNCFNTSKGADQVTNEISRSENMISNKRVIVFDIPGLLSSTSNKQTSDISSVLLVGPHIIVYVIKVPTNWEKEEKSMKSFVDIFGETIFPFVLVVFVHHEDIDHSSIIDKNQYLKNFDQSKRLSIIASIIASSIVFKMPEYCQDFCHKAGVGYTRISNQNKNQDHDLIMELVANSMNLKANMCYSPDYYKELTDIRLVTVGKTGGGKSATGNTLLQRECFQSAVSMQSMTHKSNFHEVIIGKTRIRVIDTPGLFDEAFFKGHEELVHMEVSKSVLFSVPGPHAFLFAVRASRWTDEDSKVAEKVINWFGKKLYKYVIFIFTSIDQCRDQSFEEYLNTMPESFKELFEKCGRRAIPVNNVNFGSEYKKQFALDLISIVMQTSDQYYSNEILEIATKVFFDAVYKEQKSKRISYEKAKLNVLHRIKLYKVLKYAALTVAVAASIGGIAALFPASATVSLMSALILFKDKCCIM